MRLIADIHAHHLAHDAMGREDLLQCAECWHDGAEHRHVLYGEAVWGACRKGEAVRMPFGSAIGTAMWCV